MNTKIILFFVAILVAQTVSAMEKTDHLDFSGFVDENLSSYFANPIEDVLIYSAHYTARLGNLDLFRPHINRQNIFDRNKRGETVLHAITQRTVHEGKQGETKLTDMAAYILDFADESPDFINAVDESKKTALHHCADRNRVGLLSFLLKQPNINVSLQDRDGNNVAHLSAKVAQQHYDQHEINVKALRHLYRNFQFLFFVKNNEGKTPLDLINIDVGIFLDDPKIIDRKINSIFLKNSDGETPLHVAAKYEQNNSLKRIIELMRFFRDEDNLLAQLNVIDNQGNTALHLAVKNSHMSSAKLLLAHGADPRIVDKDGYDANYYLQKRRVDARNASRKKVDHLHKFAPEQL